MTIPDSPALDLDALTALEQAASPAPWLVDDINGGSVHAPAWWIVNDEYVNPTSEDGPALGLYLECGVKADADLIAAVRNQLPALVSALAAARADLETARAVALSNKRAHRTAFEECERLTGQLAEAREQAKQAQAELATVTRERHEAVDLLRTIWYGTVNAPARERWLRLMADATPTAAPKADEPPCHCPDAYLANGCHVDYCLRHGKPLPSAAPDPAPHCGLCGSGDCPGVPGKGCMPGPFETYEADAAPATAGADEQTTTSTWPDCGRSVLGDWCRRPVNHDGDCSPKRKHAAPVSAVPQTACSCQWSPVRRRIWCEPCAARRDALVGDGVPPWKVAAPATDDTGHASAS